MPAAQGEGPLVAVWMCIMGYLVELVSGSAGSSASVRVRDGKSGMLLGSHEVPLVLNKTSVGFSTVGNTTLFTPMGEKPLLFVRWSLPKFALQLIIGKKVTEAQRDTPPLIPVREAISGKRPRDDATLTEMFSAKRHASTDKLLAGEVEARRWEPSHSLIDELVHRECWETARALLSLPELDEEYSIRLLAARIEFLPDVVRRQCEPHLLERALCHYLHASRIPAVLENLLEWMEAYRESGEREVLRVAPVLPRLQEILVFMGALSGGCTPALARLDADLLERVADALGAAHTELSRSQKLYAVVREVCRMKKAVQSELTQPAVEIVRLDE